ncbi:hypothetical protein Cgig2_011529 [Carnegiea gigantea]|uniref:Peptidase A2 domain-containing protein n=1 Tax=Carnegiea gigantea TaxID=171969 RepID=A0A9Q1GSG2_9CARY|nr:hypothetical protein Cgig2_011529 [Carnegiea gigantea]
MIEAIIQKASEQVKKAVEAASFVRPLPRFECVPTTGCEPSYRHDPMVSHRHSERMREASHANGDRRIREETNTVPLGSKPSIATVQAMKGRRGQLRPRRRMQCTPDEQPGPLSLEDMPRASLGLPRRLSFEEPSKFSRLNKEAELQCPLWCSMGNKGPRFTSSYNEPLVVEMKMASAIMRRILVDTGSSVDIITWDCRKKLTYPGREIVPLVHPILAFGGQEVNPTGMIRLPLRFGNKVKEKNLEVDFLVVDVPTAYNVILGRPTLHIVKAIYCRLLAPASV